MFLLAIVSIHFLVGGLYVAFWESADRPMPIKLVYRVSKDKNVFRYIN